jgi:hypothetical protein
LVGNVLADGQRGRKLCAPPPPEVSESSAYGRLTLVLSPELVMVKVPAVATGE